MAHGESLGVMLGDPFVEDEEEGADTGDGDSVSVATSSWLDDSVRRRLNVY